MIYTVLVDRVCISLIEFVSKKSCNWWESCCCDTVMREITSPWLTLKKAKELAISPAQGLYPLFFSLLVDFSSIGSLCYPWSIRFRYLMLSVKLNWFLVKIILHDNGRSLITSLRWKIKQDQYGLLEINRLYPCI